MTWTRAPGLAVSFALLPACSTDHQDEDYELIIDNNGPEVVDVVIGGSFTSMESHTLEPFEVVSLWMSDDFLKGHPGLSIYTHEGDDTLFDLTLHRSYFSVPDLKFQVNVYP